jgi:23S rRNA (adenine2030-N6)-methyltransferase
MFSYRHAFHAGNHADVLKHMVLVHLFRYFKQKDKPFWFIDTHAGAGGYDLRGDYARKSGESAHGIGQLWNRKDLPEGLAQ